MLQGSPRVEDDWLRTDEISSRGSAHPNGRIDPRFGSRPIEPSGRMKRQAWERPSIGRRMFRSITRFTVAVLVGVGATLGWQSYGDAAREIILEQFPALPSLLPISTTKPPVLAATPPEIVQHLLPLTFGLEVMRRSVDQLAAKQEQLTQNIAVLQASVEEDVRQKASPTPPPPAQQAVSVQPPKPSQPKTRPRTLHRIVNAGPPSGTGFASH